MLVVAVASALLAPGVSAVPPAGTSLTLEIRPGGGPSSTGEPQTVEVAVSRANGDGVDGVVVDFEVTEGPGDDDIGTSGDTPQTPDLSCTTAAGDKKKAATCSVAYTVDENEGGSDAVRAWIDADGLDATVEADLEEGENAHAPGSGGCRADTKGPGSQAEPDGTDCAEKRWTERVPSSVDLQPETGSALVGTGSSLEATVFDQFGDPFAGPGSGTSVQFEVLAGSANDGSDVGPCDTGTTGSCSISYSPANAGSDLVCAYLAGASAECSEGRDAPERDNGADVIERVWDAPAPAPGPAPEPPPPAGGGGAVVPPAPSDPAPPADPDTELEPPDADPRRDEHDHSKSGSDAPARSGDDGGPVAGPAPEAGSVAASGPSGEVKSGVARSRHRPRHSVAAESGRGEASRPTTGHGSIPKLAPRNPAPATRGSIPRARGGADEDLQRLSRAVVTTADRFSFPLSLTLLVLVFMAVQGRIDRQDPKLRLAPLDSKHDLLDFA